MHNAEQFEFPFVKKHKDAPGIEESLKMDKKLENYMLSLNTIHQHRFQEHIDKWKRDEYGLLPNVEYIFREDGRVDWRKMIPAKYLVPNKDKYPKDTDLTKIDVTKEEDSKLLILLNGIRYISQIRGFESINKTIKTDQGGGFITCVCRIELTPNYETSMEYVSYESEADAHYGNTNSIGQKFLTTCAGNRAEVRAIRTALGIEIMGEDEIGMVAEEKPTTSQAKPHETLTKLINTHKLDFEQFKNRMNKEGVENADSWTKIEDIPASEIFAIIAKVNKSFKKKSKEPKKSESAGS